MLDHLGYVLTRDLLIRLLPDNVIAALAEIDPQRPPSRLDPDPNAGRELPPFTPE